MSAIVEVVIPAAAGILGALVGAAVGPWVTSRSDSRRWREQRQLEVAERFLAAVTAAETRISWLHSVGPTVGDDLDAFIELSDPVDNARGALRLYWPEHVVHHANRAFLAMGVWYVEADSDDGQRAEQQMREAVDAFVDAVGSVIRQVAPAKT